MEASNQQESEELTTLRLFAQEAAQLVAEAEARLALRERATPAAEPEQGSAAPEDSAVQVERERDRSR